MLDRGDVPEELSGDSQLHIEHSALPAVSFIADLVEIARFSPGLSRAGSQQAESGALKAAPSPDVALSAAALSATCSAEHPIIRFMFVPIRLDASECKTAGRLRAS